eukprot:TRINITY_DN1427_c0_g1_i1.p1 TRINITY_DN1427_c0_g1~~TRINITY_DN1427_c0_g1_i1.p1  ORF type:complete len:523 (-),score=284.04 TRINITY_DN1427_c0_g1_i1:117-1685(-)
MRATPLVLLLCLFFYLAVTAHADTIPNGYFNGRSANHVVAPRNVETLKSDSAIVLKNVGHFGGAQINDTEIADLISHFMSAGALNGAANRSQYPAVDVFAPAKANLLISVDYLGADSNSELANIGQVVSINKTAYPMSPISYLTTIATGVTPSVHGIVSSFWREFDEIIKAYTAEGQSLIGNFADFLSQNTQGKSAVVSISANNQQAIALCSHQLNVAREPTSNNFCYTWDAASNKVKAISAPSEKLSLLSKAQIWTALTQQDSTLAKILASAGISVADIKTNVARLSLKSEGAVSEFDLNTEEDLSFAVELSMIADLIARLRLGAYKSLIKDSAPDHFAVAISTLRTIALKFGEQSAHFAVAIKSVDALSKALIQEIETAYEDKAAVEVIFMGKQTVEIPSLSGLVETQYLPQIVPFASKTEEEAISAVEEILKGSPFKVVKQDAFEVTYTRAKRGNTSSSSPTDLDITPTQLASFQICLWTPIVLVIVVLAITITMFNMGSEATSGKDAMVFNAPRSGAK